MWSEVEMKVITPRKINTHETEYREHCTKCGCKKRSRIFPFPIEGQFVYVCKECWDKIMERILSGRIQ